MSPSAALALQRRAGNAAVARLVRPAAQRGVERPRSQPAVQRLASPAATATATHATSSAPGPAAATSASGPGAAGPAGMDTKLATVRGQTTRAAAAVSAHRPPVAEAKAAQDAAKAPPDDALAQGKAAQADTMAAAKPGEFDKAAFVRAVNTAIAKQAPSNLDEADTFAESGKADRVKDEVSGQARQGASTSASQLKGATDAAPDTSKAHPKPVAPLGRDAPPPPPAGPDPNAAVPDPVPAAATDLSAGPRELTGQMRDADVTDQQLATSNEPQFTGALDAKKAGESHAATAPEQVRAAEAATLTDAKADARAQTTTAMAAMAGDRTKAGQQVDAGKDGAKSKDEQQRAQVTATLQTVFDATKTDVDRILTGLDTLVDAQFSREEAAARAAFTSDHKRRMEAYKDQRYSGLLGKGRWLKDKFTGLPKEASQIFEQARAGYVARMQTVISHVADTIGTELGRAKARIAQGRTELRAQVDRLPANLRAIGTEAARTFESRFDELTETVNEKSSALVDALATRYTAAVKEVDAEIAAEKAKNQGLIDKAKNAIGGVIATILELKNLLMGVLAKAAAAVSAILKDPIGFLGKLVHAIGAGLHAFISNIGTHLTKGLVGWLTGALASAGLELPARWDLRGIFGMLASLLGLTWGFIRSRIVRKGVPEQAMSTVEQSIPIAQKIQSEGIAGVWEDLKEQVGDLKTTLFTKITEFLVPTVLVAGITWILSLLNPASAFVRACKMIVDFVTFIVTQGGQIIAFVNSVLDAVIAIATGGSGGVPALIEGALARSIPILIGVLAAVLGIGGIASRVQNIVKAMAKPVKKAIDWVVDKIVGLAKKVWAKLKGAFGTKAKDTRSTADKQKALDRALAEADALMGAPGATTARVGARLAAIRRRHGLLELVLRPAAADTFVVHGAVNPTADSQPHVLGTSNKVRREGSAYLLRRDTITHADKIVGEPESVVEADAEREAVAAELAARRPKISRVYIGTEVNTLVNGPGGQGTSIDAVGVTRNGRYMLLEAKGGNIEHGLEQLADSANALGPHLVDSFTLVIPAQLRPGLSGWRIQGYYLYQGADRHLIVGKPVRVIRTTRGET